MNLDELQSYYDGYGIKAYQIFGAHLTNDGVVFRLYAPNAKSVRVIGDFNNWDNQANHLFKSDLGFWETTIKNAKLYSCYKYVVEDSKGKLTEKADPFGFYNEVRPGWCNKVVSLDYNWQDQQWMNKRNRCFDKPMNIYEIHLGGFKHNSENRWMTYYEMIDELIPYVKEMGYTHIELMPLNEYGLDQSWGYQQFGYHAITSRYGGVDQLMMFIEACHKNDIGVIMDIVPVHFVKDTHGLCMFDGTHLYESNNKKYAETEWGTYYFDFSKDIVKSFLLSSAGLWLDKYHIDGLRLDAISNLIYYQGNKDNGINDDAIKYIKRFNQLVHQIYPNVITIAEDSSDYYKVTGDPNESLGFDYKWDLGWMNDTLKYYHEDPEYRHYDHNLLTFSMAYYFSERFLLPFSHDEVVHGKQTIIDKMWGNYEDKFAQCRNLMVYMYTHPGKKLNFMGNEIASFREFDENKELDWFLLEYPIHDAFKRLCRDLNYIYNAKDAFYENDYSGQGFKWIDADNNKQRIYSYIRYGKENNYVVVLNMAPVSYEEFIIGVPNGGYYTEILNSEKDIYNGCNMCNFKKVRAYKKPMHNLPYSMVIRIAPYAAMIFEVKTR